MLHISRPELDEQTRYEIRELFGLVTLGAQPFHENARGRLFAATSPRLGEIVVKLVANRSAAEVTAQASFSSWLSREGTVATPEYVAVGEATVVPIGGDELATAYRRLRGYTKQPLPEEAFTSGLRLVGRLLEVSRRYSGDGLPVFDARFLDDLDRASALSDRSAQQRWRMEDQLDSVALLFSGSVAMHGDLNAANLVLDTNDHAIGVLDFENAARGSAFADFASFMTSCCFEGSVPNPRRLALALVYSNQAFGISSRSALTAAALRALAFFGASNPAEGNRRVEMRDLERSEALWSMRDQFDHIRG